jgi:ferredoxin
MATGGRRPRPARLPALKGRTRIRVDGSRCGGPAGYDPRACCACLRVCEPAVFTLHQSFGVREANPLDPQAWSVTALWPCLCTRCLKCVAACPREAIRVQF